MQMHIEKLHYQAGNFSIAVPDFTLEKGVIALLTGESGCGKSSFIKLCAGILPPVSGKIIHSSGKSPALMLQNPLYQVISANVRDELAYPLQNQRNSPAEAEATIAEVAKSWQLEGLLNRNLHSLSLGELQTVMLAVTLIMKRPLTLLDEPSSHLDQSAILNLYKHLRRMADRGHSFLVASQNLSELDFCDELIIMHQGKIAGHFSKAEKSEYEPKLLEYGLIFPDGGCGEA